MTNNKPYSNEMTKIDKINLLRRKQERIDFEKQRKKDNY